MSKRLSTVLVVLCITLLASCASITIVEPNGAQKPAPSPVSVPVKIEITKSIYGRSFVVTGGATTINVSGFNTSIKSGTQNTEVLTTTLSLSPGSYTLTASGTYDQWNGQAQPISSTSSFTVTASTPTPTVSLSVSPATGDILVPRNGSSTPLAFTVTRTSSTATISITASSLPSGVTLPVVSIASTSTTASAALSATTIANGQGNAVFTASMAGASNSTQTRSVRVVPVAGVIVWLAAPFLGATGPTTPTSPDGKFRVTATRMGASRVWTLRIAPTSGNATPLDVTMATWAVAGGSNLGGIAFCPASPTLSALVLSDEDEDPSGIGHQQGVTYRLKVIQFDGGTPRQQGTIDGLKFLSTVQPRLGFSSDCSIVGGWTIDMMGGTQRNVTFLDIFNGQSTSTWGYTDTAPQPPTPLATISGATINLTGPSGQNATLPVP